MILQKQKNPSTACFSNCAVHQVIHLLRLLHLNKSLSQMIISIYIGSRPNHCVALSFIPSLNKCQQSKLPNLFSDVFSWVLTCMHNHPLCGHFFSGCPQLITDILYRFSDVFKICSDVLRCSQMFSDDHKCFWIFSRYSIDVLLMFSRCSLDVLRMFTGFVHDVFRMLRWVFWAWWNFK